MRILPLLVQIATLKYSVPFSFPAYPSVKRNYQKPFRLNLSSIVYDNNMPRGIKKENLPSKICVTCNRPFTWRKVSRLYGNTHKVNYTFSQIKYLNSHYYRNGKRSGMKFLPVLKVATGRDAK